MDKILLGCFGFIATLFIIFIFLGTFVFVSSAIFGILIRIFMVLILAVIIWFIINSLLED